MSWPQYTLIALWLIGFGFTCAKHGQQKEGTYNAVSHGVALVLVTLLLWAGGFFG